MMRFLPLLFAATVAFAETIDEEHGFQSMAVTAKDDIEIRVMRKFGGDQAYVVLRNRTDNQVKVDYSVARSSSEKTPLSATLQPKEVSGLAGEFPVDVGKELQPEIAITRVLRLTIDEANGYVLIDEAGFKGVSARLFRSQAATKRVYAVLTNSSDAWVTATYTTTGIDGTAAVRTHKQRLAPHGYAGRDGSVSWEFEPPQTVLSPPPVRVKVVDVEMGK